VAARRRRCCACDRERRRLVLTGPGCPPSRARSPRPGYNSRGCSQQIVVPSRRAIGLPGCPGPDLRNRRDTEGVLAATPPPPRIVHSCDQANATRWRSHPQEEVHGNEV
jgi:hypothetical protein